VLAFEVVSVAINVVGMLVIVTGALILVGAVAVTKFQRVYYPKASLSWVLSDEDFFPKHNVFSAISSFRLRIANGASGVQPGPNDALRTYNASSASIKNTDAPIETFNAIGNDSLKPERSVEWETGFDSRLFGNRVQFDVTYYSRLTHDALISAVIAPWKRRSRISSKFFTGLGAAGLIPAFIRAAMASPFIAQISATGWSNKSARVKMSSASTSQKNGSVSRWKPLTLARLIIILPSGSSVGPIGAMNYSVCLPAPSRITPATLRPFIRTIATSFMKPCAKF
jgi:hypothetical protein